MPFYSIFFILARVFYVFLCCVVFGLVISFLLFSTMSYAEFLAYLSHNLTIYHFLFLLVCVFIYGVKLACLSDKPSILYQFFVRFQILLCFFVFFICGFLALWWEIWLVFVFSYYGVVFWRAWLLLVVACSFTYSAVEDCFCWLLVFACSWWSGVLDLVVWVRVASGGFWFSCDGRASLFF